jgi:hypothetical protein
MSCDGASLLLQRSASDGTVSIIRHDLGSGTERVLVGPGASSPNTMVPC